MDEGWGGLPSCSTDLTCTHMRVHTHTDTQAQGASWMSQLHHRLLSVPRPRRPSPTPPRKRSCYSNTPRAKGQRPP